MPTQGHGNFFLVHDRHAITAPADSFEFGRHVGIGQSKRGENAIVLVAQNGRGKGNGTT